MHVGIAEVIINSSYYSNKQVYISGDVVEIQKISESCCQYIIRDMEGNKILVNSVSGCPEVNKTYAVKGIVVRDQVSYLIYFNEVKRKLLTTPLSHQDIAIIGLVSDSSEIDSEMDKIDTTGIVTLEEVGEENEEGVFLIVEEMPKFQGGDQNSFRMWIQQNLHYPESAAKKHISGTVFVQFVVSSKGFVKNAKVMRSADPSLDAETLRVVKASPQWEPGRQHGKPVNVQFTFPVVFILN
jgi:TonB family protein